MRTRDELERLYQARKADSAEEGHVHLIVVRLGGGGRETPARATLDVDGGLVGDSWSKGPHPSRDRQVTLMNLQVAEIVAAGVQPLAAPGDNLLVSLDLCRDNLPPGSRLSVGSALLEVSEAPHTGCKKFAARFGDDALRWVNEEAHLRLRLRGLNATVVETGDVAVGDPIYVVR